ncbi:MAG TPA: hypothetical protein VEX86_12090 [Longimicrobium sp.]|nr:hypothetical protein [Longimicrobium sp.]
MTGNKKAYDEAFERGRSGKGARTLWEKLLAPMEDNYTRQSRDKGWRDGEAARGSTAEQSTQSPTTTA